MAEIEHVLKLALLALVWGALASPLLFVAVLVAKRMKRGGPVSGALAACFGCWVAILLAPVPTPIISIFVPHALALMQSEYYARMLQDGGVYSQLLPWVGNSLAITMAVCVALSVRFFSAPGDGGRESGRSDA